MAIFFRYLFNILMLNSIVSLAYADIIIPPQERAEYFIRNNGVYLGIVFILGFLIVIYMVFKKKKK